MLYVYFTFAHIISLYIMLFVQPVAVIFLKKPLPQPKKFLRFCQSGRHNKIAKIKITFDFNKFEKDFLNVNVKVYNMYR